MEQPQYHLTGVMHASGEESEDFNGPLDVILLLLSRNKIEIQDISISAILEQYLAWLDEMKAMDMEIASEFITMASRLMLIKTKMLLSVSEQQEAQDEMESLLRSLEQRQLAVVHEQIRQASGFLEDRSEIGRGMFVKAPEPYQKDRTYRYLHDRADLVRAMEQIADRAGRELPPAEKAFDGIVGRETYPVSRKVMQLLGRLLNAGRSAFHRLFEGCRSRSELVATFLAVLELCKNRSIQLGEETASGEPELIYTEEKEAEHGNS